MNKSLVKGHSRVGDMDLSIKLTNEEIRSLLSRTTGTGNNQDDRRSYSFNTTVYNDSQMDTSALVDRPSGVQRADSLYGTFLEVVKGRKSNLDFETVQELVQTCTDILDDVQRHADTRRGMKEKEQLNWLQMERDVWRLVYSLYRDRLLIQKEAAMDCEDLDLMRSEKSIAEYLYLNNAVLREYQLIVDWLELCASEQFSAQVGHFTDRTVGWENTLHNFQNPQKNVFNANRNMVKSIDPDAPIREQRALHDLDQEDQSRLLRAIFTKIRQGKIEEAQNICEHCGHPWQAAILEGWRLSHDPNYYDLQQHLKGDHNEKMPLEGNPHRDIWKKCAWLKAESRKCDDFSRAIAAVFCGHLQALTNSAVCPSWTDLLWAHFKVQIDIRVEFEVRQCTMKNYMAMPDQYWNNKMSLEQIFDELAASKNEMVRLEAKQKMNVIVKYLVLDDVNGLMQLIREWLENETIAPQMLRFLAHLVLFLRQVERLHRNEVADKVLCAYVQQLIEMSDADLVAFYTSTLQQKEAQTILFSQFLERITETEARRAALEEGLAVGLNIDRITQYTVQLVRERELREDGAGEQKRKKKGELSEGDLQKISILEYLQFYPQHRAELLYQSNALIRQFLAKEKLECVRRVLQAIPQDSVRIITELNGGGGQPGEMGYREECAIKENICHAAYLSAVDGFNQWTFLFHNEPKGPSQKATQNFTEKMAFELKEQEHQQQLEAWRVQVEEQKKLATGLLYNVLLFPDQGWLVDPEVADKDFDVECDEWQNRVTQMDALRSICVPEVVILLHKCLHLSKDYQECVQLVDEVASENRKLYKCYPAHKMSELLLIVAESSLALLNEKCDPWGYSNI